SWFRPPLAQTKLGQASPRRGAFPASIRNCDDASANGCGAESASCESDGHVIPGIDRPTSLYPNHTLPHDAGGLVLGELVGRLRTHGALTDSDAEEGVGIHVRSIKVGGAQAVLGAVMSRLLHDLAEADASSISNG